MLDVNQLSFKIFVGCESFFCILQDPLSLSNTSNSVADIFSLKNCCVNISLDFIEC